MCSQPNEKNGFSMRVPKRISAKGRYDFAESRYDPIKDPDKLRGLSPGMTALKTFYEVINFVPV